MHSLFEDFAFVVYPVSDMAKARAFYGGTLELQETANWDNAWVEYDIGRGTLALTNTFPGREPGTKGPMLAIEVKDVDAISAFLDMKGIAWATGPFDTPLCRGGSILDPEGNELILHERKNKSA